VSSFYVPTESLLQSRAFRRLLAFSLAGHVIVFLALVLRPPRSAMLISSSPVMVQMVSMPKSVAPKPAPAKPAPPPKEPPKPPEPEPAPPPKPVVKEIVIPKEVKALPEKPKPVPVEAKKPPPPTAQELLAKMTEQVEAKEAQNAPPAPPSEAPAASTEATPGTFDPELSPWVARVRIFVRANWSGASVCRGVPEFDVDVDGGGQLSHIALTKSSGDSYCDDTAERALRKSNPLPPPPHAVSFTFNLNPKDTP